MIECGSLMGGRIVVILATFFRFRIHARPFTPKACPCPPSCPSVPCPLLSRPSTRYHRIYLARGTVRTGTYRLVLLGHCGLTFPCQLGVIRWARERPFPTDFEKLCKKLLLSPVTKVQSTLYVHSTLQVHVQQRLL